MEEKLIEFKTAVLAKEKGLKLNHCKELFYRNPNNLEEFITTEMNHDWELIEGKDWYSRPTQSLLQKWLREVHGRHIFLYHHDDARTDIYSYYLIKRLYKKITNNTPFFSYEEALEEALFQTLNLIK